MFVRYYLELPLPLEEMEEAILRSPPDWIPRVAQEAEVRGELLLAEVGFGPPSHRLEKQVRIELDSLVQEHLALCHIGCELRLKKDGLGPKRIQLGSSLQQRDSLIRC